MFYQCPGCKKNWQYPIEKCPDCFLKTERTPSKKIKVIGVSKVWISTLLHPKVPFFVLLLEDEQGRKWVQKSIKEYKPNDEFKLEKAVGDKNAVAIWRVKYDILEGIEKTISLLDVEINPNAKTLILPTLVSPAHPYFSQNTNPRVLDQVIKFLIQRGIKKENIKVASQSFNDFPVSVSAQKSKFLSVCEENGVELIDIGQQSFKKIDYHLSKENFVFNISETVFQNDLIINLPILKLDKKIGLRGALENLTRFLKKESYLGLKYLSGKEKLMVALKDALPQILTVADAVSIQRTNAVTTFAGLILASSDPLNLDRVFAEIAMIDLPEYLKTVNLNKIKIVGRQIGEVQYDLEKVL